MKIYEVPMKVEIDQEMLDGIVDSAIAYCSYWCDELEVIKTPTEKAPEGTKYVASEFITRGGELVFKIDEPFEDGGATEFVLTEQKMLDGLAKYGHTDFEDFDGPMADAALQYALFGEVIYG